MRVTLTLQWQSFKVDINPQKAGKALKEKSESVAAQKFNVSGQILNDDTAVKDYKIDEKNCGCYGDETQSNDNTRTYNNSAMESCHRYHSESLQAPAVAQAPAPGPCLASHSHTCICYSCITHGIFWTCTC
uniref:Ubiquitin-like domain-containing protein n=1 Tax=Molossus molossus TaxID=27622 RepID=A0A7J8FYV1_MOLMO|nr:hypothetical protein HJG59_008192 [Molossus molossus]